jgi:hypothetical protein
VGSVSNSSALVAFLIPKNTLKPRNFTVGDRVVSLENSGIVPGTI